MNKSAPNIVCREAGNVRPLGRAFRGANQSGSSSFRRSGGGARSQGPPAAISTTCAGWFAPMGPGTYGETAGKSARPLSSFHGRSWRIGSGGARRLSSRNWSSNLRHRLAGTSATARRPPPSCFRIVVRAPSSSWCAVATSHSRTASSTWRWTGWPAIVRMGRRNLWSWSWAAPDVSRKVPV